MAFNVNNENNARALNAARLFIQHKNCKTVGESMNLSRSRIGQMLATLRRKLYRPMLDLVADQENFYFAISMVYSGTPIQIFSNFSKFYIAFMNYLEKPSDENKQKALAELKVLEPEITEEHVTWVKDVLSKKNSSVDDLLKRYQEKPSAKLEKEIDEALMICNKVCYYENPEWYVAIVGKQLFSLADLSVLREYRLAFFDEKPVIFGNLQHLDAYMKTPVEKGGFGLNVQERWNDFVEEFSTYSVVVFAVDLVPAGTIVVQDPKKNPEDIFQEKLRYRTPALYLKPKAEIAKGSIKAFINPTDVMSIQNSECPIWHDFFDSVQKLYRTQN